jgi:hypothetical protein
MRKKGITFAFAVIRALDEFRGGILWWMSILAVAVRRRSKAGN